MLIGILSDSHGQHRMVRKAMSLFDKSGVSHIIHCGDVGGIPVIDEMVGNDCTFVWGNMDSRDGGLEEYLQTVGISIPVAVPTRLTLGGKRFAVFHGHEPAFALSLDTLDVEYVLHGHTHTARDERVGSVRVINPGALHDAPRKTVAVLDTVSDSLSFHEIHAT